MNFMEKKQYWYIRIFLFRPCTCRWQCRWRPWELAWHDLALLHSSASLHIWKICSGRCLTYFYSRENSLAGIISGEVLCATLEEGPWSLYSQKKMQYFRTVTHPHTSKFKLGHSPILTCRLVHLIHSWISHAGHGRLTWKRPLSNTFEGGEWHSSQQGEEMATWTCRLESFSINCINVGICGGFPLYSRCWLLHIKNLPRSRSIHSQK